MDDPSFPTIPLVALAISWIIYFALHSWLASNTLKRSLQQRWPAVAARYRLIYNGLAVVLIIPPLALMLWIDAPMLWQWQGPWIWVSHALLLLSLVGFWFTTRHYDMASFAGLRDDQATHFSLSPIHRHVRHPWYFFGLVLLWSRDMDAARLTVIVLATAYLWYGSRLEDRKLIEEFGARYRSYRDRVPGLIPVPGRSITREEVRQLLAGKPLT